MPEFGMKFKPRKEILSYEEMLKLVGLLAKNGVNKVRITGGEPFVRRNLIYFLSELVEIKGIDKVAITTNGVLTRQFLPDLRRLGINDINLSIDSLDRENFKQITRRDKLPEVMEGLNEMLAMNFNVKLNVVVLANENVHELANIAAMAATKPLEVRFIEEMPFNGGDHDQVSGAIWNYKKIKKHLQGHFPTLRPVQTDASETALKFTADGFTGSLGIIPAFTRSLCGGCNRIRITSEGKLRNCLYDQTQNDLKAVLRSGASDTELEDYIKSVVLRKAVDGFAAQKGNNEEGISRESMSIIGG